MRLDLPRAGAGAYHSVSAAAPSKQLDRIWGNVRRRGGPPQFSKADLRDWLLERSIGGAQAWRDEYTGEILGASEISLDHRQPREAGGRNVLENLAICSQRTNRIKGKLTDSEFQALLDLVRGQIVCVHCKQPARPMPFGPKSSSDVMKRLGQKPSFRFSKGKAKDQEKASTDGEEW